MSRRESSRQSRQGFATRRRPRAVIAIIVVLSLFAAWTMLAYSGAFGSAFSKKGRTASGDVSLQSFTPANPSKEMIYAGSHLIATEEPCVGVDTQPPTFLNGCPALHVAAASQCPYATQPQINYAKPGAFDNCPNVTVTCIPAPGSTFPVGTTTISCTATDTSNNTATCSFPLTVFSACLVDDSNTGNVVLFNASTGDFWYCCNGVFTASGRTTPTVSGCNITIDNFKGNRWVHITANGAGQGSGSAFIQIGGVTKCQITDSNMSNSVCACH